MNLADLQIDRKYETTREYEMENFEFNNISKNNKPLNKIYKRGEKEGLKISLSNNTKENYDDRYTSNQIGNFYNKNPAILFILKSIYIAKL